MMNASGWPAASHQTPLGLLVGRQLALMIEEPYSGERVILLGVGTLPQANLRASWVSVIHGPVGSRKTTRVDVPSQMPLGEFASVHLSGNLTRAAYVPRIRWGKIRGRRGPWPGALLIWFLTLTVCSAFFGQWFFGPGLMGSAMRLLPFMLGVLGATLYAISYTRNNVNGVLDSAHDRRRPLDPEVLTRRLVLSGRATPQAVPGRVSPWQRVADLKATYGELMSDVVYRIENAALFDSAAPLTKEFELKLMRWNDQEGGLDEASAASLADELELAFATAKRNAETLGLQHLPEEARHDAARAAKAARLAREATSQGERDAAAASVIRLLESIALYYMPTPEEAPKLLNGSRKSLGPS